MSKAPLKPTDRLEELVHESLVSLRLDEGLVERVVSALPPRDEMSPALHPALRVCFGLSAAGFATLAWVVNLPRVYGAGAVATYVGLGAIMLGAAIGALAIALSVAREAGPKAFGAFRMMLAGLGGNALIATSAAAALLGTTWVFLGWFPQEYMMAGLRAARSSVAILAVILLAAAAAEVWILARGKDWRPALKLVEAAGLVVSAIACAANYVIYLA